MTRSFSLATLLVLVALLVLEGAARASVRSSHLGDYVADAECGACHAEIAERYRTVGMSRSFARPHNAREIEDFAESPFEASGPAGERVLHQMLALEDGGLLYNRWQELDDGSRIRELSAPVSWVLGSGSTSRVYLTQTRDGSLYELPIAWYTQPGSWGQVPGSSGRDQETGLRLVRRECLFCHNAVPLDADFDDRRFAPHRFAHDQPEGIGCQRCHGPGRAHVAAAHEARAPDGDDLTPEERRGIRDAVRSSITNPSRLEPARRRDVCAQCHHQPAVVLFGQRQFGVGDYDFVPGDDLTSFLFKLEVVDSDALGGRRDPAERFEINHHAYRLEQSPCHLESELGRLECTSCHDPHEKPGRSVLLERTRSVCLDCHQPEAETPPPSSALDPEHFRRAECVSCHMPRRRTEDIVHVVMTDHRITAEASPEEERVAARSEREPIVFDVFPLDPEAGSERGDLAEATALVRHGLSGSLDRLGQLLEEASGDVSEPSMRLGKALLDARRDEEALDVLLPLLPDPGLRGQVAEWLAILEARRDRPEAALERLRVAQRERGDSGALLYNEALLLLEQDLRKEGCDALARAVALNGFLARAWYQLGACRRAEGRPRAALEAFERAAALDSNNPRSRAAVIDALESLGRDEAALALRRYEETHR